ncbi:hypothetical protein GQ42DRAFT_166915 [Ramicandelaber brevisporus]|nr:hypothetical protein GQ42DRAFT_166915 [Ramicandelaber brevisporus]
MEEEEQRRTLRRKYRELLESTDENRRELTTSDASALLKTVENANRLFSKVHGTYEATLDAKLLMTTSGLGAERAQQLRVKTTAFSKADFTKRLRTLLNSEFEGNDDDGEVILRVHGQELARSWGNISRAFTQYSRRVPAMDLMLGPLETQQRTRRVAERQKRTKQVVAELERPQELQATDIVKQENETSRNVKAVYDRLELEAGGINFFHFAINPYSFGQTVENLFYISFLIRDGKAAIDDEQGFPIIFASQPPTDEDYATGELKKRQFIMEMDHPTWQKLIKVFNITEPIIPHRAETTIAGTSINGKFVG